MSKSIYEEALKHLNVLNNFVIMWCDEIDLEYHDTYKNNYQKVKNALELGKLYKELANLHNQYLNEKDKMKKLEIIRKTSNVEEEIKELENE